MSQGSVHDTTGYVNYVYNISARGITQLSSQLLGLSGVTGQILGQLAFQTTSYLSETEGALMTMGVAASVGLTKATQQAMEFDQALSTISAISGKSGSAIDDLGEQAMDMSEKFGMAVGEMTRGLETLARAGVSAGNMGAILEQAMGLSKLEGLSLEASINDLISTTNLLDIEGLDLESPEYAEAVKKQNQRITATSEAAPINAQDIIHTLEHVGGYASSTRLDQEDLFAVIAQLGSKGTKSEIAGTSLRAFLAAGQKDTAQRALKRIGLNVKDLWKNDETIMSISDMKDVLDEAMEAKGYTQQEKLEFYSDFAGYKQANQIMKIDTTSVREFKDKIDRSWDISKKIETVIGTAETNFQGMVQAGLNFLTKVGKPLLPIVSTISWVTKNIIGLIDKIPGSHLLVTGGMILVAIKAISTIFNKIGPQLLESVNNVATMSDFFNDIRENLDKTFYLLKNIGNVNILKEEQFENEINRIDDNDRIQYYQEQGYDVRSSEEIIKLRSKEDDKKIIDLKRQRLMEALQKKEEDKEKDERVGKNRKTAPTKKSYDQIIKPIEDIKGTLDNIYNVIGQFSTENDGTTILETTSNVDLSPIENKIDSLIKTTSVLYTISNSIDSFKNDNINKTVESKIKIDDSIINDLKNHTWNVRVIGPVATLTKSEREKKWKDEGWTMDDFRHDNVRRKAYANTGQVFGGHSRYSYHDEQYEDYHMSSDAQRRKGRQKRADAIRKRRLRQAKERKEEWRNRHGPVYGETPTPDYEMDGSYGFEYELNYVTPTKSRFDVGLTPGEFRSARGNVNRARRVYNKGRTAENRIRSDNWEKYLTDVYLKDPNSPIIKEFEEIMKKDSGEKGSVYLSNFFKQMTPIRTRGSMQSGRNIAEISIKNTGSNALDTVGKRVEQEFHDVQQDMNFTGQSFRTDLDSQQIEKELYSVVSNIFKTIGEARLNLQETNTQELQEYSLTPRSLDSVSSKANMMIIADALGLLGEGNITREKIFSNEFTKLVKPEFFKKMEGKTATGQSSKVDPMLEGALILGSIQQSPLMKSLKSLQKAGNYENERAFMSDVVRAFNEVSQYDENKNLRLSMRGLDLGQGGKLKKGSNKLENIVYSLAMESATNGDQNALSKFILDLLSNLKNRAGVYDDVVIDTITEQALHYDEERRKEAEKEIEDIDLTENVRERGIFTIDSHHKGYAGNFVDESGIGSGWGEDAEMYDYKYDDTHGFTGASGAILDKTAVATGQELSTIIARHGAEIEDIAQSIHKAETEDYDEGLDELWQRLELITGILDPEQKKSLLSSYGLRYNRRLEKRTDPTALTNDEYYNSIYGRNTAFFNGVELGILNDQRATFPFHITKLFEDLSPMIKKASALEGELQTAADINFLQELNLLDKDFDNAIDFLRAIHKLVADVHVKGKALQSRHRGYRGLGDQSTPQATVGVAIREQGNVAADKNVAKILPDPDAPDKNYVLEKLQNRSLTSIAHLVAPLRTRAGLPETGGMKLPLEHVPGFSDIPWLMKRAKSPVEVMYALESPNEYGDTGVWHKNAAGNFANIWTPEAMMKRLAATEMGNVIENLGALALYDRTSGEEGDEHIITSANIKDIAATKLPPSMLEAVEFMYASQGFTSLRDLKFKAGDNYKDFTAEVRKRMDTAAPDEDFTPDGKANNQFKRWVNKDELERLKSEGLLDKEDLIDQRVNKRTDGSEWEEYLVYDWEALRLSKEEVAQQYTVMMIANAMLAQEMMTKKLAMAPDVFSDFSTDVANLPKTILTDPRSFLSMNKDELVAYGATDNDAFNQMYKALEVLTSSDVKPEQITSLLQDVTVGDLGSEFISKLEDMGYYSTFEDEGEFYATNIATVAESFGGTYELVVDILKDMFFQMKQIREINQIFDSQGKIAESVKGTTVAELVDDTVMRENISANDALMEIKRNIDTNKGNPSATLLTDTSALDGVPYTLPDNMPDMWKKSINNDPVWQELSDYMKMTKDATAEEIINMREMFSEDVLEFVDNNNVIVTDYIENENGEALEQIKKEFFKFKLIPNGVNTTPINDSVFKGYNPIEPGKETYLGPDLVVDINSPNSAAVWWDADEQAARKEDKRIDKKNHKVYNPGHNKNYITSHDAVILDQSFMTPYWDQWDYYDEENERELTESEMLNRTIWEQNRDQLNYLKKQIKENKDRQNKEKITPTIKHDEDSVWEGKGLEKGVNVHNVKTGLGTDFNNLFDVEKNNQHNREVIVINEIMGLRNAYKMFANDAEKEIVKEVADEIKDKASTIDSMSVADMYGAQDYIDTYGEKEKIKKSLVGMKGYKDVQKDFDSETQKLINERNKAAWTSIMEEPDNILTLPPSQKYQQGRAQTQNVVDYIKTQVTQVSNFIGDKASTLMDAEKNEQASELLDTINSNLTDTTELLKGANSVLNDFADVFPPLTIAVLAFSTVISGIEKVALINGKINSFLDLGTTLKNDPKTKITDLFGHEITGETGLGKAIMGISGGLGQLIKAIETFIKSNLGPLLLIVGAFTAVTTALDWSYKSHEKYVKQLEDEEKANKSRSKGLQTINAQNKKALMRNKNEEKEDELGRRYRLSKQKLDAANLTRTSGALNLTGAENDMLWGKYGIASALDKMQGKYESTAAEYDGTSGQIRRIKEHTTGGQGLIRGMPGYYSQAEEMVAAYYDANQLAIGVMDEYKDELGELYDAETNAMRKHPDENPRETKEFQKALDKFVEATGITEEHAQQYLDYMQTEHNVDNATQAMQAQADLINANTEMKIQAIAFGGNPSDVLGLNGIEAQQNAMVQAQADMIQLELSSQLWWKAVWSTITSPIRAIIAPIFSIVHILSAIWSFVTGNWDAAGMHMKQAGASLNVLGETATYWGAWATAESTDFNSIGKSAIDENDRANYGNAKAAAGHGGPRVPIPEDNSFFGIFPVGWPDEYRFKGHGRKDHKDQLAQNAQQSFFSQLMAPIAATLGTISGSILTIITILGVKLLNDKFDLVSKLPNFMQGPLGFMSGVGHSLYDNLVPEKIKDVIGITQGFMGQMGSRIYHGIENRIPDSWKEKLNTAKEWVKGKVGLGEGEEVSEQDVAKAMVDSKEYLRLIFEWLTGQYGKDEEQKEKSSKPRKKINIIDENEEEEKPSKPRKRINIEDDNDIVDENKRKTLFGNLDFYMPDRVDNILNDIAFSTFYDEESGSAKTTNMGRNIGFNTATIASFGDDKEGAAQQLIADYIHEISHSILKHAIRQTNDVPNDLGITRTEDNYNYRASELESREVTQDFFRGTNVSNPHDNMMTLDMSKQEAISAGVYDEVNGILIAHLSQVLTANREQVLNDLVTIIEQSDDEYMLGIKDAVIQVMTDKENGFGVDLTNTQKEVNQNNDNNINDIVDENRRGTQNLSQAVKMQTMMPSTVNMDGEEIAQMEKDEDIHKKALLRRHLYKNKKHFENVPKSQAVLAQILPFLGVEPEFDSEEFKIRNRGQKYGNRVTEGMSGEEIAEREKEQSKYYKKPQTYEEALHPPRDIQNEINQEFDAIDSSSWAENHKRISKANKPKNGLVAKGRALKEMKAQYDAAGMLGQMMENPQATAYDTLNKMEGVQICDQCGHKNPLDAKVCEQCGARLDGKGKIGGALSNFFEKAKHTVTGGEAEEGMSFTHRMQQISGMGKRHQRKNKSKEDAMEMGNMGFFADMMGNASEAAEKTRTRALKICPECGHQNDPDANICEQCGARLDGRGKIGGFFADKMTIAKGKIKSKTTDKVKNKIDDTTASVKSQIDGTMVGAEASGAGILGDLYEKIGNSNIYNKLMNFDQLSSGLTIPGFNPNEDPIQVGGKRVKIPIQDENDDDIVDENKRKKITINSATEEHPKLRLGTESDSSDGLGKLREQDKELTKSLFEKSDFGGLVNTFMDPSASKEQRQKQLAKSSWGLLSHEKIGGPVLSQIASRQVNAEDPMSGIFNTGIDVLTGDDPQGAIKDKLTGGKEGVEGVNNALKNGGQVAQKAGGFLKGKGGIAGKAGNVLERVGGGASKVGGKGIGKVGGKLMGKVGGKIAGKVGGKIAGKVGAQVASKVLAGGLAATGIGAPLAAIMASPIGGFLMEGAMNLGGKALGAIGGAVKGIGGFLGFGRRPVGGGRGGGGLLKGLAMASPLGMMAGAAGGLLGSVFGGKGPGNMGKMGGNILQKMAMPLGGMMGILGKMFSNDKQTKSLNEKMEAHAGKTLEAVREQNAKTTPTSNSSGGNITIQNININTADDPEAIKAMFLELIVELQEQVNPRLVSRTAGKAPESSTSTAPTDDTSTDDTSTDKNSGTVGEGTTTSSGNQTGNTN